MQPQRHPQGMQGQAPKRPPAGGLTEVRDSIARHADAPPLDEDFEQEKSEPQPLSVIWSNSVTPFLKSFFSRRNKVFVAPQRILILFYRLFFTRLENPTITMKRLPPKAPRKKKKMVRAH